MMSRSIDDLVATHREKQLELLALGRKIAQSATATVVAFVDLSESTALKQSSEPDGWLGYVYGFIEFIDEKCRAAQGTTVKRIGDELMLTFPTVTLAETFLRSLLSDPTTSDYTFKVALDAGDAYHFKFSDNLADDPYGSVVDRCARIAKLAGPRTALCSSSFREKAENPNDYKPVGAFSLRGFREPENLFVRALASTEPDSYLQPLLSSVDSTTSALDGYRSVGRKLTGEDIKHWGSGRVRPFLARELLNIPRLPYSPTQFAEILSAAEVSAEKEKEFYGYLVEWDFEFESYKRNDDDITVLGNLVGVKALQYNRLRLMLPNNYYEVVRDIKKGQRLHVRGVIDQIFLATSLNYVDLYVPDVAQPCGAGDAAQ